MSDPDRRARRLLALGAALGIALAAFGIADPGGDGEQAPEGAVALVNGQPISRESFARFSAAIAAERKQTRLDADTRRRLLERMIEEELLFQRGLALGLERHEPSARRAVVAALIDSVAADAEGDLPDEAALRRFHQENRERFARAGRVEVDAAFVGLAGRPEALALRRAEEIAARLRAGEPFEALEGELADEPVAPLPGGAHSFETLRQYLGPTVARAALDLEAGQVGEPVRGGDGYWVLRPRARLPGEVPTFEEVREEVRAEYLRSRADQALRDYLDELRGAGEVRILDPELR